MATQTEMRLMEKIIRAKIYLEKARRPHSTGCPAEDLTGHPAPCRCGADTANSSIQSALRELDLEK